MGIQDDQKCYFSQNFRVSVLHLPPPYIQCTNSTYVHMYCWVIFLLNIDQMKLFIERKRIHTVFFKQKRAAVQYYITVIQSNKIKIESTVCLKGTVARDFCLLRLWGLRIGPTDVTHPLLTSIHSNFNLLRSCLKMAPIEVKQISSFCPESMFSV